MTPSFKRAAAFLCSSSAVLIIFMSWFGCGGGSSPSLSDATPVAPVLTKIGVSPSAASIQVGQQQKYAAVGYDQFNNPMTGISFRGDRGRGAAARLKLGVIAGQKRGLM